MAKTKENLDELYLDENTRQQMRDYVSGARANGDSWANIHNYVDNTYRIPNGYYSNADGSEFYTLSDQDKTMLSEGAQRQAMSAVSNSLMKNGNTTGAHSTVEQIRKQDAAFSGGVDGSQYITQPGQYSMANVGNMSSRYQYTDPESITDTVMKNYQEVPSIYNLYSYQDTPDYYSDVDLNIPRVADGNYSPVSFNRDGIDTNLSFDRSGIDHTTYNPEGINTDIAFDASGINPNVRGVSERFQYEKAPQIVDNYANVINSAADSIANRAAFEYNPDNDPLFAVYQKQYAREGDRAAANALANAAMLSGGQASTAAVAASQQAQNYYGAQMADKIPELYQIAYNQYQNEGDRMRQNLDMYRALRSDDYGLQESNRDQHNYDQQFLYDMAQRDIDQENVNNQMAYNISRAITDQENQNNAMRKAIADTYLSNDQFNEQMDYNLAIQDRDTAEANRNMLYNMATQDMNADEFNNQLQFDIANADASNALQRAAMQVNIANGRSNNFQNDRSTQIGMAENEQGRITDANNWWYQLANADEAQRQFNEQQKFNIAAADIAQENTNREAKYNVWNDNYNRSLDAADLMAAAGDFSRYGTAYGLTPEETALLKAAYEASLTQGSGGGSSGGGSSRGRSGSRKKGSSGNSSGYNGLVTSNQHDLTQDLSDVDWLRVKGYGRLTPSEVYNIMKDPSSGNQAGKIYEQQNADKSYRYTTQKKTTAKSGNNGTKKSTKQKTQTAAAKRKGKTGTK